MEFNDLITLIILFVFFLLPSIFRGLGRKKKKPARPEKKRSALFGKLTEAVRGFIRDLEKQAMEAKRKADAQKNGTVWEEMTEEEIETDLPGGHPAPVAEKYSEPYEPAPFTRPEKQVHTRVAESKNVDADPEPKVVSALPELKGTTARTPLQNAVIWAEIIGKPVALKND